MVLKTTLCRFSGLRIYPGKGVLFVRTDSQQYLFLSKKTRKMFINRKRPAKLAWTTLYRKQHKKDQVTEVQRKKKRSTNKSAARSIAGVSMEVINKRRQEKPEVRQASRDAAMREVKERAKKLKAEKATKAAPPKSKAPAQQKAGKVGQSKR